MGASFGAVASLSAAWRSPGTFGRLLLQSGSFAGAGARVPSPAGAAVAAGAALRAGRTWPSRSRVAERVFVSCGAYESLICENRGLVPVLRDTGMDVHFVEALDGHNWASWRDVLGIGLPWLFAGG